MKRILVGDDGSKTALLAVEQASELAAKTGAELIAFAVLERGPSYADRGPRAQEEIAQRVAWAAVKKRYRKIGGYRIDREIGLQRAGEARIL